MEGRATRAWLRRVEGGGCEGVRVVQECGGSRSDKEPRSTSEPSPKLRGSQVEHDKLRCLHFRVSVSSPEGGGVEEGGEQLHGGPLPAGRQ